VAGFTAASAPATNSPASGTRFSIPKSATDQILSLEINKQRFPFLFHGKTITIRITAVDLLLDLHDGDTSDYRVLVAAPFSSATGPQTMAKDKDKFGPLPHLKVVPEANVTVGSQTTFAVRIRTSEADDFRSLKPGALKNVLVVFTSTISGP
jgi:hypothetical protein